MATAVSLVCMFGGTLLEVLDMTAAAAAGIAVGAVLMFAGPSAAWSTYVATAVLALLLLPSRWIAGEYAAFFGLYSLIKWYAEKTGPRLSVLLKGIFFASEAALVYAGLRWLGGSLPKPELWYALPALAVFAVYDLALTKIFAFLYVKLKRFFR